MGAWRAYCVAVIIVVIFVVIVVTGSSRISITASPAVLTIIATWIISRELAFHVTVNHDKSAVACKSGYHTEA
jgi:hypothetical protein